MKYLTFGLDDSVDGIATLEATASTAADQHAAVVAEVQQVLDWAWRQFPDSHGPIDDGMLWDHDLQVTLEAGGWHTVTLTLTGTGDFVERFLLVFPVAAGNYGNTNEYIRDLVRRDQEEQAKKRLRDLLEAGLASGPGRRRTKAGGKELLAIARCEIDDNSGSAPPGTG